MSYFYNYTFSKFSFGRKASNRNDRSDLFTIDDILSIPPHPRILCPVTERVMREGHRYRERDREIERETEWERETEKGHNVVRIYNK